MSRPLLAKKRPGRNIFQTLAGHTEDALRALAAYLKEHRETVAAATGEQGLPFSQFCQVLFLALFLHDLGKATREFQERLVKEELDRELSHTFFSLPLVHTDLPAAQNLLVKALVLTHHTQPFDELYLSFDPLPRVSYLIEEVEEYLGLCKPFYERHFKELFPLCARPLVPPQDLLTRAGREELRQEVARLHREIKAGWPPARLKAVYCLAATLLKYCDSQASRAFLEADLGEGVHGPVLTAGKKEGAASHPGTTFSGHCGTARAAQSDHRYALLLLPPGKHRLQAILSRALELTRHAGREKLVWVTPGQYASGYVYAFLARSFGAGRVEMAHAPSYFAADPYAWGLPPENGSRNHRDAGFKAHIFSAPVTVATLDHLVFSLVHGFRFADYALGNLLKAVVVLDGLPSPQGPTLGYTLDALKLLRELHIPHLIAGELLAPSLEDFFKSSGYKVVVEHRTEPCFEVTRCCGDPARAVVESLSLFPRQVVFAPDAFAAARLAGELRAFLSPDHLVLCHSLLNHGDRLRLEGHLLSAGKNGPCVLVTDGTLDAACFPDCDAVHTGEAGAAALVRRCHPLWNGGRLVLYLPEGLKNSRAFFWPGARPRLPALEEALEEEFRAHRPGPTNLREVFLACTLSGPSPREVRYSRQPLVGLWPYRARLMDVLPQCFWDGSGPPPHFHRLLVKLPAAWYEEKAAWFYPAPGPAEKMVLCRLPYRPGEGLTIPEQT